MEAGDYTLQVSGPHTATTGIPAATAETDVEITPGDTTSSYRSNSMSTPSTIRSSPTAISTPLRNSRRTALHCAPALYDEDADTDVDVYALPVTGGEPYRVNLERAAGNFDAALTVYAEDGAVLAENDDNQTFSNDPLVDFEAPDDGVVYVEVTEVSGAAAANSPFNLYDLDIAPVIGEEEEPNGSAEAVSTTIQNVDFDGAQSVPLGSALNAALGEDDADIFEVVVAAGETLVADVETEESGVPDTLLGIYNEDGEQVAFNDDYNGRESRAIYTSETDGTYYVVVIAWDSINPNNATTGDYGLMLTSYLNAPTE